MHRVVWIYLDQLRGPVYPRERDRVNVLQIAARDDLRIDQRHLEDRFALASNDCRDTVVITPERDLSGHRRIAPALAEHGHGALARGDGAQHIAAWMDTRAELAPEGGGESRGSETILLVEDQGDVRELTREILEMAGYTVLEAARGDEALRLCRDSAKPIDLLLTDVVMPQMSGPELARHIAELRPGTKVVYMSGYTDDALGHHGVLDPEIVLLPKPFTPESLMQHLRLALDASPPRG